MMSLFRFSTKLDLKIALMVGKFLLYLYFNDSLSESISNLSVLISKSLLHIYPMVFKIDMSRSP